MYYQVYADESYILKGKENLIALGGWFTTPETAENLEPIWRKVLNKYGVDNFHFKEYADRKHHYAKKYVYDDWTDLKREDFLFELALVACELGVPVGASSTPDKKKAEPNLHSLKVHAYGLFCESIFRTMNCFEAFDPQTEKIGFVFDKNEDPSWQVAMDEAVNMWKSKAKAPFELCEPKTDTECCALQAADLYVYSMRQNADRFFKKDMKPAQPRMLDFILEKNRTDVGNHTISIEQWARIVQNVIVHSREWKKTHPTEKYLPLLHCPMLQPPEE